VGLGFAISIVVAATISAFVTSKWGSFAPKDYEECAQSAAKDARSKDALSVLLSICRSEFKGRRTAGGGYDYYDSCQERTFAIKGPNPTLDEQTYMREQCSAYLDARARVAAEEAESERRAQQAAQEARTRQLQAAQEVRARELQAAQEARARQLQAAQEARAEENRRLQELENRQVAALRSVKISETKIECYGNSCKIDLAATNGSKEVVTGISFGWMFPSSQEVSCPAELSTKKKESDIKLRPGETTWISIYATDAPPEPPGVVSDLSQRHLYPGPWMPKYCIKVTGVDIAPEVRAQPTPGTDERRVCQKQTGDDAIAACTAIIRAIADYDQAIKIDPNYALVYWNRGNAYAARGDIDGAIADYDRAIGLGFNNALSFYSRGNSYRYKGKYDLAIADYTEALRLDPKTNAAYANRGFTYFLKADFPLAATDLQRSIELKELKGSVYPILWRYLALGRTGNSSGEELVANAARFKTKEWPYPVIEFYLGKRSAAEMSAAAAKPEERCEAQFYLGEWYLLHNDRSKAASALGNAATSCPKAFYEYGGAVAELKRLNQ
jgi:lipoprotein NlpI